MKQWYVSYSVSGWDKKMSAGPYSSAEEAESHRFDIAGYEGVYGVSVEMRSTLEEQEP